MCHDTRIVAHLNFMVSSLSCRGFRQATRGADTGAFHHPYFRRDQPELCLHMVCQKSRDRQPPSYKRRLPPKKRCCSEIWNTQSKKNVSNKMVIPPSSPSPTRPISVSTDDHSIGTSSIASQGSSNGNNCRPCDEAHPKVVLTASVGPSHCSSRTISLSISKPSLVASAAVPILRKTSPGVLPFVSNDSIFVASTLKKRDEEEVLRAARSMLYEAFMQAIERHQRNQHSSSR
jgi:hypothetical protein